ncbi:regulatory protein BlaR1 [Corallococcus coralloides DSM 2259]|uniref:Regulatory protein BlaR1 n=1 Tax=Corallococcus coralloides (strain ATCC 25202 / DSM 2259 / NBRC 100086 / M2) TaxID=1144275 RepID=H8MNF3_CORCM|nr:M56 family metallopeptidase [Corallococcus coralloides]AFE08218.1 regulatory protein BlaR1 [Corallococcus coralloides DSM 2259]
MSMDALVEAVGRGTTSWLMHGVWQTTAVALVAAGVLALMRHRSARSRYAVGCLALTLLVAGPSASVLLASWTPAVAGPGGIPAMAEAPGRHVQAEASAMTVFAPPLESSSSEYTAFTIRLSSALVMLWLAGAVAGLVWRMVASRRAARQWLDAATPAPVELHLMACRVAERLGLRRPVEVLESSRVPSPLVLGAVRPVLVLPRGASERLTPAQLEAVLAHELAHVQRRDPVANLAQHLVEALFFFHPAARWLSQRVRLEREHCCDDAAVHLCGDARMYSSALLGLEELRQQGFALGAGTHPLAARVQRLLGHGPVGEGASGMRRAVSVGGALAVLAVSGVAWDWEAPEDEGFGTAACTQAVYPKDFSAIATWRNDGRAIRSRIFVSRCGRIRLESADGAKVPVLLYDATTLERVALDDTARTHAAAPRMDELGLPLHLPGGCTENKARCESQGQKTVAGRSTRRWHRRHTPNDTVTQWFDDELGYPVREESDLFGTLTLTDIQVGAQRADRFFIPSGYQAGPH